VALVALRHWTLYPAQPPTKRDSPVHEEEQPFSLPSMQAGDVLVAPELEPVLQSCPVREASGLAAGARRQRVLVVVGDDGRPRGVADLDELRWAATEPHLGWAVVGDVMVPWAAATATMTLDRVGQLLADEGLRQLPVMEGAAVVGFVGEAEIARAALRR
jgi:CIC family chloride channel protein